MAFCLRLVVALDQMLGLSDGQGCRLSQDEPNRSAAQACRLPGTGFWLPRPFGEMWKPITPGSRIKAEKSRGSKNSFGSACTA